VEEALRTRTHPERLTPLVAPTPFDAASFAHDPKPYLSVSEPGRVWQVKAPGPGVPVLTRLTPRAVELRQGQTAVLQVRTAPLAPVSFTAFDGGVFQENGLPACTVRADAQGLAAATFSATPGVIADSSVAAGSPEASGVVRFTLVVVREAAPAATPTAQP
jgi:hypothetical protein